jgi:hypothetical protein
MNAACPHCGGHVLDDGKHSGQVVACPFCDKQFQMPSAEARAAAEAAAVTEQFRPAEVAPNHRHDSPEKPWQVTTMGVLRIVSGVVNVTLGLSLFFCIAPLLLVPLGIAEIMSGANFLAARPKYPENNRTLAILEIVAMLSFGVISLVVGILSLVWSSQREVESYFAALAGSPLDYARPLGTSPQSTVSS